MESSLNTLQYWLAESGGHFIEHRVSHALTSSFLFSLFFHTSTKLSDLLTACSCLLQPSGYLDLLSLYLSILHLSFLPPPHFCVRMFHIRLIFPSVLPSLLLSFIVFVLLFFPGLEHSGRVSLAQINCTSLIRPSGDRATVIKQLLSLESQCLYHCRRNKTQNGNEWKRKPVIKFSD